MGTKVLVVALGPRFAELADADSRCYSKSYPNTRLASFENAEDLLRAIGVGNDIVHLLCEVSADGTVLDARGQQTTVEALIASCIRSNVKMLWIASEHKPEVYIKGFKTTTGKPLNLVLTIDRRGARFGDFLEKLLAKMSAGATMPTAWVSLVPQTSNDQRNQDAPACIFAAGRGGIKLR